MSDLDDIHVTTKFEDGDLFITVPAETLKRIKAGNIIGKQTKSVEVTCIVSYLPHTYDPSDDGSLF